MMDNEKKDNNSKEHEQLLQTIQQANSEIQNLKL